MASVQLKNIRKTFADVNVLHDVSVDIEDGSFVVLVGPSGCGKSTLLRMLAGLETLTGGEIRIGSKVVNHLAPKDRDIAMVFQSYALYPQMTVAQNMGFALELAGATKADIDAKVLRAARILSLEPLLKRYPRQLSGGQRQRVAMGRAIVRDPQVFLFDEPLSNLDAKLRVQMRGEIKALQKRLGTTTIYVTHDQIEAMTMADKIVVMRDGKVEQVGAPLELYDRPANQFVASFLGSPAMNFLEGVVANEGQTFLAGPQRVAIPIRGCAEASVGQPLVLGVRPEHITIDAAAGVPAEVVVVEPTGPETFLVAQVGGAQLTCVVKQRISVQPGESIPLAFNTPERHFFDPQTTRRVG